MQKPHGYVRLAPTATLFVARDDKAPHAQYFPSEAAATKAGGEAYPVFRLAAYDGEWAEVETVWGDDRQCGDGMMMLADFELRLFVHVDALQPVTIREAKVIYPDETSLTVTSGLPVVENAQGHRAIVIDGATYPAPIEDDAVGIGYDPAPHFSLENAVATLDESKAPGVRFAGVKYPVMPLPRLPAMPGMPLEPLDVFARRPLVGGDGGSEIVTLRTSCAQYEVVVSSGAVLVDGPGAMGGLGIMGTGSLHAKKGSPVFASSGEHLGITRGNASLDGAPEGFPTFGHRCFQIALRAGGTESLELCFTPSDLDK